MLTAGRESRYMSNLSKIAQRHKRFEMLLELRETELGGELHRRVTDNQPNTGGSLNRSPFRHLTRARTRDHRA